MQPDLARAIAHANEALSLHELALHALPAICNAFGAVNMIAYRMFDHGMEWYPVVTKPELLPLYEHHSAGDVLQGYKLRHNPRVASTTARCDQDALKNSAVYHECYRPLGAEHQLVGRLGPLCYGEDGISAVVIARSKQPFSSADEARLRRILPALEGAVRREARIAVLTGEKHVLARFAESQGGLAAFDREGRVRWRSDALRDVDKDTIAALSRQAMRVRAGETTDTRARWPGGSGELHTLGDDMVVLSGKRDVTMSEAITRAAKRFNLRPSEVAVLKCLARGCSNNQVARELFISTETVRSHVHHLLKKMSARSRLEAIAKLQAFQH